MPERSIPYFNTIMRCDDYAPQAPVLPQGYAIVPYRRGFEADWARLECGVGDFPSVDEAKSYFVRTFLADPARWEDIRFLVSGSGEVVGSCIAWQERRGEAPVAALHWLVVDRRFRGLGLGRALCRDIMNRFHAQGRMPVYLHTQPWSYRAIFLYLSMGFRIAKSDTFSHYENQYTQAMDALKTVLTDEQMALLLRHSAD